MDFPAGIGQASAVPVAVEKLADAAGETSKTKVDPAVVVESEETGPRRKIGNTKRRAALAWERPSKIPGRDRLDQGVVVKSLSRRHEPFVESAVGSVGGEREHVVGHPDPRARNALPDRRGSGDVPAKQVLEGPRRRGKAALARRDEASQVTAENEDDRLVQSDPEANLRQSFGNHAREPGKPFDARRALPSAFPPKP